MASASSPAVGRLTALRRSGRSMVTMATEPSVSKRTGMEPPRACRPSVGGDLAVIDLLEQLFQTLADVLDLVVVEAELQPTGLHPGALDARPLGLRVGESSSSDAGAIEAGFVFPDQQVASQLPVALLCLDGRLVADIYFGFNAQVLLLVLGY